MLVGWCRRFVISVLAVVLGLAMAVPGLAQSSSPSEYQVKAVFLYNFVRFVEWPAERFASPASPYVVCVLGKDPFGSALDTVFAGRSVANRRVELRRIPKADAETASCHIVFIGEQNDEAAIEPHIGLTGVLTVGEGGGFTASGGMIELHLDEQRVRFSVNVDPANTAGLKISSQLLKLAEVVQNSAAKGTARRDVQ